MQNKQTHRQAIFEPATETEPHLRYWPSLAEEIGQNECLVLLQFEFLVSISECYRDGERWIYGSLGELQRRYFRGISEATLGRTINRLEAKGLIKVGNYNRFKYDKTAWYALNLEGLAGLHSCTLCGGQAKAPPQNETGGALNEARTAQNEITVAQNEATILQDETTIQETHLKNQKKKKKKEKEVVNPGFLPVIDSGDGTSSGLAVLAGTDRSGVEAPGIPEMVSAFEKQYMAAFGRQMGSSQPHQITHEARLVELPEGGHQLLVLPRNLEWFGKAKLRERARAAYEAIGGQGQFVIGELPERVQENDDEVTWQRGADGWYR